MVAFAPLKNSHSRTISRRMPAHVGAGVPANINKHRGLSPRSYDVALGRSNHLYSVAALTNSAGGVVERYRYDTYGNRTTLAPDGITTRAVSSYNQQVGFTGRYEDKETKLWYFRERMYSSQLGRFIARDPGVYHIERPTSGDGYDDGMGQYAAYFVSNWLDPFGLRKCEHVLFAGHRSNLFKKLGRGINQDPDNQDINDPNDPKDWYKDYKDDQGRRIWDRFGNANDYSGGGDKRPNCGDRLGYVGCNRDWGNAFIDGLTGGKGGVPGVPRPKGGLGVGDPKSMTPEQKAGMGPGPQGADALNQAWDAMLKQAKADCDSKKTCCDQITVRVECDADMKISAAAAGLPGFCSLKQVFNPCR